MLFGGILAGAPVACELALPIHEAPSDAGAPGLDTASDAGASSKAKLLFRSGFEATTSLQDPPACAGVNCRQSIVGGDVAPFRWPMAIWGGMGSMQLLANEPVDSTSIADYIVNDLQVVTAADGGQGTCLHQLVKQNAAAGTLDQYVLGPASVGTALAQGTLYVSYLLRFGDAAELGPNGYRVLMQWFQGGGRIALSVLTDANAKPSWALARYIGDTGEIDWSTPGDGAVVPTGWFRLEFFWKPGATSDGRIWVAIDGATVLDRRDSNLVGPDAVSDIQVFVNAGSKVPHEQWIDDVEIWDDFPSTASPH
jgi:hypothetical protein